MRHLSPVRPVKILGPVNIMGILKHHIPAILLVLSSTSLVNSVLPDSHGNLMEPQVCVKTFSSQKCSAFFTIFITVLYGYNIYFDYSLLNFVTFAAFAQIQYCQKLHTFQGKNIFLKYGLCNKCDIQTVWGLVSIWIACLGKPTFMCTSKSC